MAVKQGVSKMKIRGSDIGLEKLGITDLKNVYQNVAVKNLVSDIVKNKEGVVGHRGAAMVDTGIYTGRSPKDKYIVGESLMGKVW